MRSVPIAYGQLREQPAGTVQEPRLHQRREHRHVAARLRLAVIERADAVPGLEADVPEEREEAADRLVRVALGLALEHHEQVDVGLRMQLAAAVTADRHEVRGLRELLRKVQPAREDDLVDDLGARAHERLDRIVALEALGEPLARLAQRLAERADGRRVGAQRAVERRTVDQRGGGGRARLRVGAPRQPRSAAPSVKTS